MQAGFHFWNFSIPGAPDTIPDVLSRTARTAEQGGFSQFTVMDHWFQMERVAPAEEPMLEAYTTLGFVAAHTHTMRIGPLVTGVTYRYPGLLAKIVTTLDVLSTGRAMLGIGAAWYDREHHGLGVPYPPIAERFERLEETLQIAQQMWSDDNGPYRGTHYELAETLSSPQPIQRPHPPIMIGGQGERKTLRLVAQYAQIVNLTTDDPERVAHLLDVLRGHCERLGTDYDAIEKTVVSAFSDPHDPGFFTQMEKLSALGITQVVLGVRPADPVGQVARLADEVLPTLAQI
ncbi:LLM class F420-dependent oxidoreductase [Microbacterium sp. ET2]|uniref:LLM class F420-dependent oxidoreductase n=1 Tax=Microbacterium albipurpureum TaxID=3050384 RepID=UPI00259C76E6|nr:LLM class F420-dependent oxidoreductase [Microbacterium sp. ET2 (Ac-2212)]WJL96112.1 LLM class F420-dependent oxidoreductase [Microbacterium sp. ET2 (Ac-2212)]